MNARRHCNEPVGGILVREPKPSTLQRDLVVERDLADGGARELGAHPRLGIRRQRQASALAEEERLPDRDRRQPLLVAAVAELLPHLAPQTLGLEQPP